MSFVAVHGSATHTHPVRFDVVFKVDSRSLAYLHRHFGGKKLITKDKMGISNQHTGATQYD